VSCISSVLEINENSIEFSLSTWTWSRFKSLQLEPYKIDLNKAYNTLLYKTVRRRLKSAGSKIVTKKTRPKLLDVL